MREARKAYEALMKWYPFGLEDLPGEEWLPVPEWQDYQVLTFGRVKSFHKDEPRIIRPTLSTKGYLQLELRKAGAERTFKVHRLVGTTFIPNPESQRSLVLNQKELAKFSWVKIINVSAASFATSLKLERPIISARQFALNMSMVHGNSARQPWRRNTAFLSGQF